jgi:hypothetical protein
LLNLPGCGFSLSLNLRPEIFVIGTTQVATDTIDHVATDTWGNTATSTRTVIIEAASLTSI